MTWRTFLYRIGLAPQSELDRALREAGKLIGENVERKCEADGLRADNRALRAEIAALKAQNDNLIRGAVDKLSLHGEVFTMTRLEEGEITVEHLEPSRVRLLSSGESVRGV